MIPELPHIGSPAKSSNGGCRLARLLIFCGLFCILLVIGVVYWLLNPGPGRTGDDTPLPKGPVKSPLVSEIDSTSSLRFHFRTSLNSLERIVNKVAPRDFPIPANDLNATGQLSRANFTLSAKDASCLKLDSRIDFHGSAKLGIFEAKSATVSLSGSTISVGITPDWNWRIAPDVKAEVTKIDLSWLPDALAGWLLNNFVVPGVKSELSNSPPISFRPLVESLWKQSNQDITLLNVPLTVVGLRPQTVYLGGPLFERDGSLVLTLGLNVQSWAAMGEAGRDLGLQESVPLPNLKKVPISQETTKLRLPILVCLQDAPRFFQPQTLQVLGGTMLIRSIELGEKDGICYIRGRVRFDVPADQTLARPFSGETTLVVQGRPSCDPNTGEIYFNDLTFSPKSDSILVEILGQGANAIRDQLQSLAPVLSGWVKNRLESQLNAEAEKFLEAQINAWAAAAPLLENEIKTVVPTIKNIQIKPVRLETTSGYFVLVIEARADLGLSIP